MELSLENLLKKKLQEPVKNKAGSVLLNENKQPMTALEAMVMSIVNNAMKGDLASMAFILALVNSREMILTQAQQGNLASMLTSSGGETNVTTTISAEDLVLTINNFGRRRGFGTLQFG